MPAYEVDVGGKTYDVEAPDPDTAWKWANQTHVSANVKTATRKGFGTQLSEGIADIPRQLELTARHGIEGVTGGLGMLSEPFRKGLNLLPGVNLPSAEAAGRSISDIIGLPSPQTKIEKIAAEPSKLMAGGMGMLGASRVISKVPGIIGDVAGLLAANPAQQLQSAAGAGLAGGYTKETGGTPLAQGVASLMGGIGAPMAVSAVKGIPQAIKNVVEYLAPGVAQSQIPQQVDIAITNTLKPSGLSLKDLPASVLSQIRDDIAAAQKTSGEISPDALRRLVDYRITGATPTRAGLTLDPGDVTRQRNTAKFGMNSSDPRLQQLGQIENANNRTLIDGLNGLGAGTGNDPISGANKVISRLSALNTSATAAINDAYKAARATGGRSAALDPYAFTQKANNLLDEALLGGKLPADVRNLLNKAATGEMPLTVDTAEQFKTRIGDLQRATIDKAERKALGMVRQALDDTPLLEGQGQPAIDAFNKARALNRQYMSVVDRVPALQAVRDGMEPDRFVNQFIIGTGKDASVMDVAKLKFLVKDSPEAVKAIREQMLSFIKSKATSGANDEVANLSQAGYRNALNSIGERKLKLFFTNPEMEQIKAIGRVASYEQFQPRGSAVNNSNTAGATLSAVFEKIANSPIAGKIPFAPQAAGSLSASLTARRALNAPAAIMTPVESGTRAYPYILPAMAGAGLLVP